MPNKKIILLLVVTGIILVFGSGLWLATATPASAQCGSQASSCKNCHEVQGEKPVNADGTAWHQSHAFGDFCYICHAGNSQVTDKAGAHASMVPPLSDVKASCQQCHPADLSARAQVYATTLGIEIDGDSAPVAPVPTAAEGTAPDSPQPTVSVPVSAGVVIDDPNLVDYQQRYNEIVLGKKPINWGNAILIAMIGMLLVIGGGFVIYNERLVKVSFGDTRKPEGEYPPDVLDMLPALTGLKPQTRKSLRNILDNPKKTEKVLGLIEAVVSDEKTEE